ncbi:UDP-glucose/GDP-mannose dehydrogenase family protein [Alteromonas sediminis]|uniref:UDP-glucose 6-dehydrogenase n=1 Tax=Alteromonas sediminis TaxID=2259342 RepID=A0A3N5Y859_9ALTE|nr:UDP-glucose/GDP-mannose dehydrogenase family protein [Alteromonas sediminis]RPJ67139.1 UDP-glucose/GDP-mannose dehydrogenase family protein [Alteromonas sediminis]
MARISIMGLGYVGAVCCACQANDGHQVIGVDINEQKNKLIASGKAPIVEAQLDALLTRAVTQGTLTTSSDTQKAVLHSDISFVCVGTPSDKNGGLDLTYIERVCEDIGSALKEKSEFHVVVIRSTVLPGTVMGVVKPILEEMSGKQAGVDFGVATNPEFLREGTAVEDYRNPPMTVIGCLDERSESVLKDLYADLPCKLISMSIESAELIKYSCNAWHATKVAFANEIGSLAKAFDVDGRDVMNVLCEDKVLNLSSYYMRPAFAFGGSCLPKDLRALDHSARSRHIQLPLVHAVLESNRKHIYKAFSLINKIGKTRIGLLGLSFKAGTDDLRESPLVELASILTGKGYDLQIYDPNLTSVPEKMQQDDSFSRHVPFPYLLRLLNNNVEQVLNFADLVIIGNPEPEFIEIVKHLPDDKEVLDLVGVMKGRSEGNQHGICW